MKPAVIYKNKDMIIKKIVLPVTIVVIIFLFIFLNLKVLIVNSGSMAPVVNRGDLIFIHSAKIYKTGETITFCQDKNCKILVTHRVFDLRLEQGRLIYITKGEANDLPDTREIKTEEIVGKVIFIVPYLGYVAGFIKQPIVAILLICILLILLVFLKKPDLKENKS